MLYEGTTGIQALDLMGRKVLGSGGKLLMGFTEMIDEFCDENSGAKMPSLWQPLKAYKDEWLGLSMKIGEPAMENPDEAGAAAVDYLMYSGYVTLAYFWARMAVMAQAEDRGGDGDDVFLRGQAHDGALLLRASAAAHRRHKDAHAVWC